MASASNAAQRSSSRVIASQSDHSDEAVVYSRGNTCGVAGHSLLMDKTLDRAATSIRPADAADVDAIVRTYLESAELHARLDPERYSVPLAETISRRYLEEWQHLPDAE